MKKLIFTLLLSMILTSTVYSQQDSEGCKDHKFFNRLSNFLIESCTDNFASVNFQIGANEKFKAIEGNVTTINYIFNSESGKKMQSALQIVKNYENAIVSKGGKKIFQGIDNVDGGPLSAVFTMSTAGKEYWVYVKKMYEPQVSGEVASYSLIVLEKEAMKQEIEASEMFNEINKNGSIALYINFETGKAEIKEESSKIIDQIAEMLNTNANLKISIEGHTDNVGNAAANQTLSENRAKAVMSALISKGIDKTRLSSKGWGQTKSVSDNDSDDGKAKNRRVEIVKL